MSEPEVLFEWGDAVPGKLRMVRWPSGLPEAQAMIEAGRTTRWSNNGYARICAYERLIEHEATVKALREENAILHESIKRLCDKVDATVHAVSAEEEQ